MYIQNIGFIPCGTYNYLGFNWIVSENSIHKSMPYYSDKFIELNLSDVIVKLEIAGLHRTITGK